MAQKVLTIEKADSKKKGHKLDVLEQLERSLEDLKAGRVSEFKD